MINCYQCQEQISAYIDQEISYQQRGEFEQHIAQCANCRAQFQSIQAARQCLRELPEVQVSDQFFNHLQQRILADRNARIRRSQQTGFSFNRIPSFVYGFAAAFVAVIIGFVLIQSPLGTQNLTVPAPVVQKQPVTKTAPGYDSPATVSQPQNSRYASSTTPSDPADSNRTSPTQPGRSHPDNLEDLQQRIKTVKNQR